MTVLKRVLIPLGELLVWLIVASFVVFALLSLLPGDVAQVILGANADPKAAATVRSRLGLDLPWPQRYWDWISSLVRGDLGTSIVSAEPIGPQIASRLAVTGWLVGLSLDARSAGLLTGRSVCSCTSSERSRLCGLSTVPGFDEHSCLLSWHPTHLAVLRDSRLVTGWRLRSPA